MKKTMFFSLIIAITLFSACSKSGHLDDKPATMGEFAHFQIVNQDTIWTGKVSKWTYDSKLPEVKVWFDGNGDGKSLPFTVNDDDIYSLLDHDVDSVGVKRSWEVHEGKSYQRLELKDFYSGIKYNAGDKIFVVPDAMDISFDKEGKISQLSIRSHVGGVKVVDISPSIGDTFISDILQSKTPPLVEGEYMKDETFRMVTYSISSK